MTNILATQHGGVSREVRRQRMATFAMMTKGKGFRRPSVSEIRVKALRKKRALNERVRQAHCEVVWAEQDFERTESPDDLSALLKCRKELAAAAAQRTLHA